MRRGSCVIFAIATSTQPVPRLIQAGYSWTEVINLMDFDFLRNENIPSIELVCADGQPAFRVVIYGCDGSDVQVRFIGTDGTEITPTTWIPGGCASGLSPVTIRRCNVDNAATLNVWLASAIDAGDVGALDVFTGTDFYGLPEHPNQPDSTSQLASTAWGDAETGGSGSFDQSTLEFWLVVPNDKTARLRVGGSSIDSGAVYIGDDPTSATLAYEWDNGGVAGTEDPFADLYGGCCTAKYVKIFAHDPSAGSNVDLQWSLDDGATWETIPSGYISSTKPYCSNDIVWIGSDDTLTLTDLEGIGPCCGGGNGGSGSGSATVQNTPTNCNTYYQDIPVGQSATIPAGARATHVYPACDGSAACTGGTFAGSYVLPGGQAIHEPVESVLPADVTVTSLSGTTRISYMICEEG